MQAAGQDMPRDRDAVGGEDSGQLPLTDPDRRRDLFCAQAGFGQVLLYIGACGGAVRSRWSRGASGCQRRDQVEHGALVGRQGSTGSSGPAGDSGQCPCVLIVSTAVSGMPMTGPLS